MLSDTSLNTFISSSYSFDHEEEEEKVNEDASSVLLTKVDVAAYEDIPDLEKLKTPQITLMYNTENVHKPVHTCSLNLLSKSSDERIVAGMCLNDYPNVPSVPNDDWVHWVRKLYGIKDLNSYNTFWVHLVVYDEKYADNFMTPLMQYIFHEFSKKNYVLFVVPSVCHDKVDFLGNISTTILPIDYTKPSRVQTLRLLVRQNFAISYKVRRAVEEDNDDLVPLIDLYSERPRDMYGDFYIAEIITRHPDAGRQIIVAEYKGVAVSVLCLNENVDYDDLNQAFNLRVFTGLFKPKTYKHDDKSEGIKLITSQLDTPVARMSDVNSARSSVTSAISLQESMEDEPSLTMKDIDELSLDLGLSSSEEKVQTDADGGPDDRMTNSDDSVLSEIELSIASEAESVRQFKVTGEKNAFVIEISAALPGHEYSLGLLLEASFECFPNKDYCVISMPPTETYFSLLRHFSRVTPLYSSFHPHELYVVNKITLNPVSVRLADKDDVAAVLRFANCMETPGLLCQKFENSLNEPGSKLQTFFLISGSKKDDPIGIIMVNDCTELPRLKLYFALNWWTDITQEKNEDVGVIEYFCMSQLFRRHSKFFLREVHRISSRTTLFYAINRYDSDHNRSRPLPTALADLFAVPPRKICTSLKDTNGQKSNVEPFSLYVSTPRLTNVSRFHVNTRIVVVGSSYTAVAFLKALLFSSYKRSVAIFNNVTLVSMHGLCHQNQPHEIADLMSVKTTTMDYDYMAKLNLRCYVNVVSGQMTAINRRDKTITINKKYVMSYDLLFLMCGVQYGVPRKPDVKDYLSVDVPRNMFSINTETDAVNALLEVKKLTSEINRHKYTIVVYGCTLDAYCCVATLLEFGVYASHITLVELNKTRNDPYLFQDGDVYEVVSRTIKQQGVNIYTGFRLIDWSPVQGKKTVSLKLESNTRILTIEALAVFMYPQKSVNVRAYKAIIQCGIVFDGRVVVTPDCRTNDPFIYAAGTLTKYPRRYFADQYAQTHYNHEEVGKMLGKKIRAELIPFEETEEVNPLSAWHCWENSNRLVPIYEKPLITYCVLPGRLYYLNVSKPGFPVPLEAAMADDDYGSVLVTGNCKKLGQYGYFRLHLSTHNTVETITCLSFQRFNYKKLVLLWGKHESMLNNLVIRFESFCITDLFQYFENPWCSALYHDEFDVFVKQMMKIMTSKSEEEDVSPMEDLTELLVECDFKQLSPEKKTYIEYKFADSGYEEMIQRKLIEFIGNNLDSLDMYAHPSIISSILTGRQKSPLFDKI